MTRALAAVVVAAVAGVAVLRRRLVVVSVTGTSMHPTLRDGDRVLVRRAGVDQVARGDIVVLEPPVVVEGVRWLVKRAVAVPGDAVPRDTVPALREATDRVVPDGALVVVGDNRAHSSDSRTAGYFPADGLLGVVVRRLGVS